jgi:hypothetical protein
MGERAERKSETLRMCGCVVSNPQPAFVGLLSEIKRAKGMRRTFHDSNASSEYAFIDSFSSATSSSRVRSRIIPSEGEIPMRGVGEREREREHMGSSGDIGVGWCKTFDIRAWDSFPEVVAYASTSISCRGVTSDVNLGATPECASWSSVMLVCRSLLILQWDRDLSVGSRSIRALPAGR